MLTREGDIPARYELLSMVKKHSSSLAKETADDDKLRTEMDDRFWRDIFDMYFVLGKESRGRQDDDLIFFVRKQRLQDRRFDHSLNDPSPYFVRRWAPQLDSITGESLSVIDWRRSFYLNLIAHTSFTVTVAICSHQALQDHEPGQESSLSPIYKVVKTVYASPSRVNFHLDFQKESETAPAYPDICFSIDDFDSTFDAVVLTDTDHCYCVLLNAHDGAAFPDPHYSQSSSSSSSVHPTAHLKKPKVTLFSGFVSYSLVKDAYGGGRTRFGGLFSLTQSTEKPDKILMKGPGGCGEVEVVISGVTDQSQLARGPFSPVSSKKGFGIGSVVQKAASVASIAAKQVYAAAASPSFEGEMVPLKCCLMSVSLPWESIASDLLFKGRSPVNL